MAPRPILEVSAQALRKPRYASFVGYAIEERPHQCFNVGYSVALLISASNPRTGPRIRRAQFKTWHMN